MMDLYLGNDIFHFIYDSICNFILNIFSPRLSEKLLLVLKSVKIGCRVK